MITEIESFMHLHELLPAECIADCSETGDCYEACSYWVQQLGLSISRDKCIKELNEIGSWSDEDLEDDNDFELNIKLLWIAAGYE